ncbi:hypothetical protein DFH06DRAFT_1426500 [Mycena polygramma]|nr:hypothetical protein DFH06DRAFT_1426500 [Mycena polygramma]
MSEKPDHLRTPGAFSQLEKHSEWPSFLLGEELSEKDWGSPSPTLLVTPPLRGQVDALSAKCENLEKKLHASEEEHRRQMAELSKDAGRAVKMLQAVQTRLSLGAATAPSAVKKTVAKIPARGSRKRLCYSSDEEPKLSVSAKRPKVVLDSDSGDDEKPQLPGKTEKAGQLPEQTEKAGAGRPGALSKSVSMVRPVAVRSPSVGDVPLEGDFANIPLEDDEDEDPFELSTDDMGILAQAVWKRGLVLT